LFVNARTDSRNVVKPINANRYLKILMIIHSIGLFAVACSSDDDNNNASTTADLTLNLQGLEALGSDFVYERWIIVNGAPVNKGTFSSSMISANISS
jgi:hypothetical protein